MDFSKFILDIMFKIQYIFGINSGVKFPRHETNKISIFFSNRFYILTVVFFALVVGIFVARTKNTPAYL